MELIITNTLNTQIYENDQIYWILHHCFVADGVL